MMPGEGIGPEMMDYVKDVYKAAGTPVDFGDYHHYLYCTIYSTVCLFIYRNGILGPHD